jgi:PKD domain
MHVRLSTRRQRAVALVAAVGLALGIHAGAADAAKRGPDAKGAASTSSATPVRDALLNPFAATTDSSAAAFDYSPSAPTTGKAVTFTATSSCSADPCSYRWKDLGPSGDGSWPLGTGAKMDFTFQNPGTKYVQLAVTDAEGNTATLEQDVDVSAPTSDPQPPPTSTPPTAAFSSSPTAPTTGDPVTFSGTASKCDATPCAYTWTDVGPDGNSSWPLGKGETMKFTFQHPGTKYVQLAVTDADGSTATAERDVDVSAPDSSPTPDPTPTPTPTTTPTPDPPTSPSSGDCTAANNCYPKPQTSGAGATGVPAGHSPKAGCTTNPDSGAVLTDCSFGGGTTITTTGSGATYRFSEFHGQVTHKGSGTLTVEYSDFGPTSGCQDYDNSFTGSNYTVRNSRFNQNVSEGPRDSGSNIVIEDNFIGPMCSKPGDHADGVQGYYGGTNVLIRHNTIDERTANDVTSPIFIADSSQSARVEDNLVAGGGYSLRLHDDFSPDHGPWTLIGNRIVDGAWSFGPMDNTGTSFTSQTCSDNRIVTIDGGYNVKSVGSVAGC